MEVQGIYEEDRIFYGCGTSYCRSDINRRGHRLRATDADSQRRLSRPADWKPQTLSVAEEKKWIDAVKLRKTKDGASIIQVLEFAERMRPKKFKVNSIDVGYSGGDGKPDGVSIGYWIGAKRLFGDRFTDLWYDVQSDGLHVIAMPTKNKYTSDTIVNALEAGRDAFLSYIDKMYRETCVDPETKDKTC